MFVTEADPSSSLVTLEAGEEEEPVATCAACVMTAPAGLSDASPCSMGVICREEAMADRAGEGGCVGHDTGWGDGDAVDADADADQAGSGPSLARQRVLEIEVELEREPRVLQCCGCGCCC